MASKVIVSSPLKLKQNIIFIISRMRRKSRNSSIDENFVKMKIWDEKMIECATTLYVNIYALELM